MLIPALVSTVVPALVNIAEGIFRKKTPEDSRGAEKKAWVMGMLEDIWEVCERKDLIPMAMLPMKELVLEILSRAIDRTVQGMKEAKA